MNSLNLRISLLRLGVAAAALLSLSVAHSAPTEGGLYIAGAGFSFQTAANRGIAQNPGGRRFFVLAVPPETAALSASANAKLSALRERVLAANGVLLVCQRDIDNGRLDQAKLAAGVVAVRGWPPANSQDLQHGQRYFADEVSANLPADNGSLRKLRSTCS